MQNFQVTPIGKINVNEKRMFIEPKPKYIPAMQALDGFSHLSVIWWFSDFDMIDANDGTPVLDIKPYTPSSDRIEAPGVPEWCSHWPKSLEQSENFDWGNEFNF